MAVEPGGAGLLERDLDLSLALELQDRRARDARLRLVGGEVDGGLSDGGAGCEGYENENHIQFHNL